jgi:hypothetical protein
MATSRAPIDGNATAGSQDWEYIKGEKVDKVVIKWTATAGGASNRSSPFPVSGRIKKISYSKAGTYVIKDEYLLSVLGLSPAGAGATYNGVASSGGNTDFPYTVCGPLNCNVTNGGASGTGTIRIYLE